MEKANMEPLNPVHHAILIGVNWYPENPLKGAVSDVKAIEAHLGLSVPSARLHTLTATESEDPNSPGPTEEPEDWPTNLNVFQLFNKVTEEAKAGDFVYIHFSGHGTTVPGDKKNSADDGPDKRLALVLLDKNKQIQYFLGRTLAHLVNYMAGKGIFVTLVLDCCFSGSVNRGESVRLFPYDPKYQIEPPLEGEAPLENTSKERSPRDAHIMSDFIIEHPDRHAIIVASKADQKAKEVKLDVTKQVHGQLSLFLLTTLQSERSIHRSIQEVYDRVSFHFRHQNLEQHPVLYGNERQPFFGGGKEAFVMGRSAPMVYDPSFYEVHAQDEGKFSIQAGTSQAVRDGDEFTLYPSSRSKGQQLDPVVARVTRAGNFYSDIEPVGASLDLKDVEWRAVVRLQSALRQCPIKLSLALPEIPKWEEDLKKRSLETYTKESSPTFFLKLDVQGDHYAIRDIGGQEVPNLPAMDKATTTIDQISGILEHLSRFRLVKSLSNHEAPDDFNMSFEAFVSVSNKRHDDTQVIKVRDQTPVELVISNNGDHDLYVSIYNLGPQWNVVNVGKEAYQSIAANNRPGYPHTLRRKLKLTVPDAMKARQTGCDDILKVFVTSHPAWMYNLQLPKLSDFPALTERPYRYSSHDDGVAENWATRSFRFRTELPVPVPRTVPVVDRLRGRMP